ncbi:MAG: ParB/RepB/Spo0J family partition protein [Spirochaetes bacterium]|nr:ParB/RepB/Spo0J family partition protein [Acidobacteriota bacterium]MCX7040840.1 ParB/RepB/Spo0J family partition protein [Spirochaetota bacterium]
MSKRALGKGISALLGDEEKREGPGTTEVALSTLRPNPSQPRKDFADARLRELADSIRQKGVLQPILVEAGPDGRYTIIAGERRFRAAKLAGLEKIPVIVGRFGADEKLEIALIENVQREDLTPIEEAQAYRRLMDMAALSQEQVAAKVGKDRSTIANSLRLLKLPEEMQQAIARGEMSPGHARAILMLVNPADQQLLFRRIVDRGISVREAEEAAAGLNRGKKSAQKAGAGEKPSRGRKEPEIRAIEEKLIEKLGTKVEIKGTGKKGRIEIAYYSIDDLDRLLELLKIRG